MSFPSSIISIGLLYQRDCRVTCYSLSLTMDLTLIFYWNLCFSRNIFQFSQDWFLWNLIVFDIVVFYFFVMLSNFCFVYLFIEMNELKKKGLILCNAEKSQNNFANKNNKVTHSEKKGKTKLKKRKEKKKISWSK